MLVAMFMVRCIASKESTAAVPVAHSTGVLPSVKRPILRIPNLCIHLQSAEERKSFTVNKENHLAPILSIQKAAEAMLNDVSGSVEGCDPRHPPLLLRVVAEELGVCPRAFQRIVFTL